MLRVQETSGNPYLYQELPYLRPSGYLTRTYLSQEGLTSVLNFYAQLTSVG